MQTAKQVAAKPDGKVPVCGPRNRKGALVLAPQSIGASSSGRAEALRFPTSFDRGQLPFFCWPSGGAVGRHVNNGQQTRMLRTESNPPATDVATRFLRDLSVAAVAKLPDGTVLWGNPEYERLLGKEIAAIAGKKVSDIWPPEYAEKIIEHDRQVAQTGTSMAVLEMVPASDKEYVRFTIRFPIFDETRRVVIVGAVGCYWDQVVVAEMKIGESVKLVSAKKVAISRRPRK